MKKSRGKKIHNALPLVKCSHEDFIEKSIRVIYVGLSIYTFRMLPPFYATFGYLFLRGSEFWVPRRPVKKW